MLLFLGLHKTSRFSFSFLSRADIVATLLTPHPSYSAILVGQNSCASPPLVFFFRRLTLCNSVGFSRPNPMPCKHLCTKNDMFILLLVSSADIVATRVTPRPFTWLLLKGCILGLGLASAENLSYQTTLENFQIVWKFSKQFGNFPRG